MSTTASNGNASSAGGEGNHGGEKASLKGPQPDTRIVGNGVRIGIVHSRWNAKVVDALVEGAKKVIEQSGATCKVLDVPGSYELVYGARRLAESGKFDAIICVGCLIKGETMHFEYICEAVSQGIMKLNVESPCPVIFGVLACLTEEQALARAGLLPGKHNHGEEWGLTSLEMAQLTQKIAKDM